MKKLMFAAVAALACTASFAETEIPGENIVGYQNITVPAGFTFFTATFKNLSAEGMDIQKITSLQADGSAWKTGGSSNTKCAGAISVQKTDAEGHFLDTYLYYSTKTPQGWYDINGEKYIENVTLANGEGLIVNNTHPKGALILRVSGEVDLAPARMIPAGFSFCGNFTPVEIDLQQITSLQADGSAWKTGGSSNTKCAGAISIQKTDTEGHFLDTYLYYSTKEVQGWYDINGEKYIENIKFAPGEGFIVNNTHPKGPCQLVFPNPLEKTDK